MDKRATARVSSPHPRNFRPYNDYDGETVELLVVALVSKYQIW